MSRRGISAERAAAAVRVLVVESRALLALGVHQVLGKEPGIEILGHVRWPEEALPIIAHPGPDVIVMNPESANPARAEAMRRLRREARGAAFVVLGGDDDDAGIIRAIELGAEGHVGLHADPQELVATIHRVAGGDHPIKAELRARPYLMERVVDDLRNRVVTERMTNPFSSREREVLRLGAKGLGTRQIGEALALSPHTVRNHFSAIMHKIGAPNRIWAVMFAVRQDWLDLTERPELAEISSTGAVTSPRPSAEVDGSSRRSDGGN